MKQVKEAQSLAKLIGYDYSNVNLFIGKWHLEPSEENTILGCIKSLDFEQLKAYLLKKEININNFDLLDKGVTLLTRNNPNVSSEQSNEIQSFFSFYRENGATLDMIMDFENDRKTFLMYLITLFNKQNRPLSLEWLVEIIGLLIKAGCKVNASDGSSTPLDLAKNITNKTMSKKVVDLLLTAGAKTYQEYYLNS